MLLLLLLMMFVCCCCCCCYWWCLLVAVVVVDDVCLLLLLLMCLLLLMMFVCLLLLLLMCLLLLMMFVCLLLLLLMMFVVVVDWLFICLVVIIAGGIAYPQESTTRNDKVYQLSLQGLLISMGWWWILAVTCLFMCSAWTVWQYTGRQLVWVELISECHILQLNSVATWAWLYLQWPCQYSVNNYIHIDNEL